MFRVAAIAPSVPNFRPHQVKGQLSDAHQYGLRKDLLTSTDLICNSSQHIGRIPKIPAACIHFRSTSPPFRNPRLARRQAAWQQTNGGRLALHQVSNCVFFELANFHQIREIRISWTAVINQFDDVKLL